MLTISRSGTGDDKTAVPARKAIILVPGMHRCGTSALSGTLNRLGAAIPGELLRPDDYNKKGYFENKRINAWHENLLDELKSRWDDPLPLGEAGLRSICTGDAARDLIAVFRQECDGEPLVLVKDPRLCRLLPLWIDAFAGSDYDLFAILPIRHPFEVAASLRHRNSLPLAHGLALWLQHVLAAERASRGLPRCFVSYGDLLRDWRSTVQRIGRTLELSWPRDIMSVADEIDEFLSVELRHHQSAADTLPAGDALHHLCLRAWDALMLLCADGRNEATRAGLDQVALEYERALGILGPLVAALDSNLVQVRRELVERDAAERDDAARREAAQQYWQDWVKQEHDMLEQDLKAERDNAVRREAALQASVEAERDRLEQDLKAERDNAVRREAALQASVEAERDRLEQDLKAERDNAVRREAALQASVEAERDRLEQDLKAERDNAVRREAALQASVEAERDAADRSAQDLEESTAQNRRLSEEVANLQTRLHASTTSAVWRATWPIRRAVMGASTKLDVVPPDLAKLVSACFDEVWYDQKYGLEARKLRGLDHYFRIGMKAGYSPNAAFDEDFYLSTNPDVGEAVQAGALLCGFEHYIRHGRFEGRSSQRRPEEPALSVPEVPPDLAKLVSACFDEVWYDQKYGLEARKLRGLDHYFRIGMKAGYSPNAAFDEDFYLSTNPDVGEAVQAGALLCGFEHYIRQGRFEGRSSQRRPEEPALSVPEVPPDLAKLVSACFDEVWYDQRYGLEARKLRGLDHYFRIGMKAGYSPNAAFDEDFYLSTNPDVGEAVQAGALLCGFEHYIRQGRFEGRSSQRRPEEPALSVPEVPPDLAKLVSACFDEVWYDQKYGLEARKLRGLDHYFRIGMKAGYSPNAAFDEDFYLSTNRDVGEAVQAGALLCGFEHYIRHGRFEGRSSQRRPEEPALSVPEVPPDLAKLVSACFDEVWYDQKYGLEARKLRGLDHYFRIGMKAGYSPNAAFDEDFYLSTNPDVGEAVQAGALLCGFEHYIRHGRFEGRSGQGRPHDYSHLRPMFDEDWYDQTYELKDEELHGFAHYLAKGARRGYSPYADFDEEFYSAFYSDVRMAISSRGYLCGYEHYVLVGRTENRLTKPILTKMLDLRYPGLTDSVGIAQAREIERRLAPMATCSGADQESYWILVPTLDPNIFFAGYKALIEFIVGLGSLKRPITVVICYHDDDGSYFRYWITQQSRIAEAFRTVRIVNGRRLTAPLRLSPTDKIFAYSAWEAHLAHHMAAHVKSGLFGWLVQEYEAVFHDYSAEHVITASAYHLPHYPIFNSTELKDYFHHHRLGIFSGDRLPSPRHDFAVFNHPLTKLSSPSLAELKSRSSKTLIFYARPEPHAKRNLFPLALIALEEMAQQGSFVGPWEFHGVGALTETTIPLGRGHQLQLHAKMTEAEYIAFMHQIDIGLSLMYAPHPGLIAFEMASVGARVVTNAFDNRSETYLRGLSENIVPCEPTISGIKKALTEAIESSDDFSGRVRGMRINRSQGAKSWSEVFNDDFFHCEMGGFLGTDQQIVSKKTS